MCGVPYHSYQSYLARLIARGYKVAICEQMEDPAAAQGLVEREIVRIVTPGTALDASMLEESRNNYIAAVFLDRERCGLCFCDLSTGRSAPPPSAGRTAWPISSTSWAGSAPGRRCSPPGVEE